MNANTVGLGLSAQAFNLTEADCPQRQRTRRDSSVTLPKARLKLVPRPRAQIAEGSFPREALKCSIPEVLLFRRLWESCGCPSCHAGALLCPNWRIHILPDMSDQRPSWSCCASVKKLFGGQQVDLGEGFPDGNFSSRGETLSQETRSLKRGLLSESFPLLTSN